jgi:hypothetical protein
MSEELIKLNKLEFSESYKTYLDNLTEEKKIIELETFIKLISDNRKNIISNNINYIRQKRDEYLIKTDYYFSVPDIIIDEEKKLKILNYRQELRDFPSKIIDNILYIDNKEINIIDTYYEDLIQYIPKLNIN